MTIKPNLAERSNRGGRPINARKDRRFTLGLRNRSQSSNRTVLRVDAGMGQGRSAVIRWLVLSLVFALPALAEEPTRAPAIWYRASQQCPSDAEFLAKLTGNAVQPRLAVAGDHIDFLVTLVDSGSETVGRLERQTRAGTVAIRELRDPSCERVAEGLALSLGLALEPEQAAPAGTNDVQVAPTVSIPTP